MLYNLNEVVQAFLKALVDEEIPEELWPSYARAASEMISLEVIERLVTKEKE